MMEQERKLIELENKIKKLEFQQNILVNVVLSKKQPWAEKALSNAKDKGLIEMPYMGINSEASYDFYRIIDLLDKLGLL